MPKKDKLFNELEQIHLEQQQRAGSKAHPVVSDAEKEKRKAEGKTRGAKGAKMDRINMTFYTDNFEYLRIMSKIKGQTMTAFCNDIIAEHREAHADLFEEARQIIERMK